MAVAAAEKAGTPVDPAIVAADNAFGLSLLDRLLQGDAGTNVAISPLSVALALQVLYNGASGPTQQAMAQTLDLGSLTAPAVNSDNAALQAALLNPDPKVNLTIANSLWINPSGGPVAPSFTQTDETYYGATVGDITGAPANVNAWVDSETHGLIPELLPPGIYSVAIIANVLYFKGAWTTAFDPAQTAPAPFTLSDGTEVSVPLMHQTATLAYYQGTFRGTLFQAVRIPYGSGRLSMLIVLPQSGTDLTSFVAAITLEDLDGWIAELEPASVSLALPRFTATFGSNLVDALSALGMGIAFSPAADFSALAPEFVPNIVEHKTVVEVDETGTVAAAATGVGIVTVVQESVPMRIDHPFLYAIQDDKTGALLFVGVFMSPT
ncbi:MAG TPA: serpin family protein [Steroidobacteraceae bacterium]|nr:serpin family protein [Steroidobacteraceae bacterium]